MAEKFKTANRILILVLLLVMVLVLLPQTAQAATQEPFSKTVTGESKAYLNGWTITIDDIYYSNDEVGKEYPLKANDIIINDPSKLSGSELTYCFTVYFVGAEDPNITNHVHITETFAVDCSKDITISGTYTTQPYWTKPLRFSYKIERAAGSHTGGSPNCTKYEICTNCNRSYNDADDHSYTYSSLGNTATESCKNGCGHNETAVLTASDQTYTGYSITKGASIAYSDGWVGRKPQPTEAGYSNNLYAGTANVHASVEGQSLTTTFQIKPASISGAVVTFSPERGQFDDDYAEPAVTVTLDGFGTLQNGNDYTYEWNPGSVYEPGDYVVTIRGRNDFTGEVKKTFTVDTGKMSGVTVQARTLTYTGKALTRYLTKSSTTPALGRLSFVYSMAENGPYESTPPTFTDAGTYTVYYKARAEFYEEATGSFEVVVNQATNAWERTPWISGWTYGDTPITPYYRAKFGDSDVVVTYKGTTYGGENYEESTTQPTEAGNYTATFTVPGNNNYTGLEKAIDFEIQKRNYDMLGAKWNYTEAFDYDGLGKTVTVIGLPSGVTVKEYSGNTATVVGDYTAKVTFDYDSDNYNAPELEDLNWSIQNDWMPSDEYMTSTPNANGWLNGDFTITPADGYLVSLTDTADGEWSDQLTCSAEAADGSVTFYLKNTENGRISLGKTVSYKLDTTAPTGKVAFVDRNEWEAFLNTISFGLFYKDEVAVKITGEDALSGVAAIEYYASDEAMTLDEVKAITGWTAMPENGVAVTLEDAKQFVYFVRITDNAGNVTYLSTDGAEYDTTAPAISGIENGATYDTTQVVTVADKNLESVELNGEAVTLDNGTLTLAGDVDATYTVKATDKAGNITQYTVTMKTAADPDDSSQSSKPTVPDTADPSDMLLWSVLLFISGAAMIALAAGKKRKMVK